MNDKIFCNGMYFRKPSQNAPSFIIGNISVNVDKFTKFIQDQQTERGWVNLDIKESRNGSIYIELNTYKRDENQENRENSDVKGEQEEIPVINEDEINTKDIPF